MSNQDISSPAEERHQPDRRLWGPWATFGFGLAIGIVFFIVQSLVAVVFVIQKIVSDETLGLYQLLETLISDGLLLSLATIISSIAGVGLTIVFVKVRGKASIAEYLGFRPITKKTALVLTAVTLALTVLSLIIESLLGKPLGSDYMVNVYNTSIWPGFLWIAVVVFAPAFEEIFFRGFLFEGFRQSRLRVAGTIIVTAIMWALLHIHDDLYGITTIFVLGIVFGIARYKTGSLWSTLLMHAFWNLLAMLATALYVNGIIS